MRSFNSNLAELKPILDAYRFNGKVERYRNLYLVRRDQTTKVIKKLGVGALQAYLIGELLSKQPECTVIPKLWKPVSGSNYFWYQGNRYQVTEKLPGKLADYYQVEDFQAAIKSMAIFHRFSREIVTQKPKIWNSLRFNPIQQWQKRLREMERCREMAIKLSDNWSKQYLKVWHEFGDQAFDTIQELKALPVMLFDTICYHDWAFHNVLINQSKAFLIDFDYMLLDHPVHDRVNLAGRYLRLYRWTTDSLLKILWQFDRYYSWKKGELRLFRLYLAFPYEYWILGRQYYIEKQPWSMQYYQNQWDWKIPPLKERTRMLDLIRKIE